MAPLLVEGVPQRDETGNNLRGNINQEKGEDDNHLQGVLGAVIIEDEEHKHKLDSLAAPDADPVLILGSPVIGGAGSPETVQASAPDLTPVVVDDAIITKDEKPKHKLDSLAAPDANSVLILGSPVIGGVGSPEAVQASAPDLTPVVKDEKPKLNLYPFSLAAPNANSVLILDSTVTGGVASPEAKQASDLGLTPVVVSETMWAAMSAADFGSYRAIVLGDPGCSFSPWRLAAAEANRAVWGPEVDGNVMVIGTALTWTGHDFVPLSGIAFATNDPTKTGLYLTLSCYYEFSGNGTPVPVLDFLGSDTTGKFTVRGWASGGWSSDAIRKVANHPTLAGLPDANMSGLFPLQVFDSFPTDFVPVASARHVSNPGRVSFADGSSGVPTILARAADLVPALCGDGTVQIGEECDDGNNVNGDMCSAQCRIERGGGSSEMAAAGADSS
jgi:cysteine-rich repeat protein